MNRLGFLVVVLLLSACGPDGRCRGTPLICGAEGGCQTWLGCEEQPSACSGEPLPCSTFTDLVACAGAICSWDVYSETCGDSGYTRECRASASEYSCDAGCTFRPAQCFAKPDGCAEIYSEDSCAEAGCNWIER